MQERCDLFAISGIKDPNWAFSSIVKFLQFSKGKTMPFLLTRFGRLPDFF
jgi:hypothetical protein